MRRHICTSWISAVPLTFYHLSPCSIVHHRCPASHRGSIRGVVGGSLARCTSPSALPWIKAACWWWISPIHSPRARPGIQTVIVALDHTNCQGIRGLHCVDSNAPGPFSPAEGHHDHETREGPRALLRLLPLHVLFPIILCLLVAHGPPSVITETHRPRPLHAGHPGAYDNGGLACPPHLDERNVQDHPSIARCLSSTLR